MSARFAIVACAFGLFLVAGCGPAKLNETKTVTLDTSTPAQVIFLNAQSKPQKINVDFSSSEKEVRVLVFKQEDAKDGDAGATADAKKALASKQGKAENFVVDVPANTAVSVVVRSAQAAKTDVTLKLTNSK